MRLRLDEARPTHQPEKKGVVLSIVNKHSPKDKHHDFPPILCTTAALGFAYLTPISILDTVGVRIK